MPFVTKARKKNDPALRDPLAGLNKAEKELYNTYLGALNGIRADLNDTNVLRAIREAIEAGNPQDASLAFRWSSFIASLEKTVPQLARQLATSANVSAKSLPKKIRVNANFENKDPRAIAWAQQRAGARIAGIRQESQKAVAEIVANGLRSQLTREQVIRQITEIVGLDSRQARALANFYEKNLQELLEDGLTFEEAERQALKLSKDYRQRLLVQRATRIARTETLAAANAGRMLSWQEADAQGLLPAGSMKRWKTATDERTCPTCGPLHNVAVPWEGSFSTGDVMPPNHPNCRCTAVIVPAEPIYSQNIEKRYYRFADGEETWRNYDYKWRKIANEMKRKIGKCQRCGKKSDLTVDHKKRLKDGGAKYDRKNLRVLCRSCNGRLSRLGTKLRKSKNEWLFAKHAPGKHDQQSHAGNRGGAYRDFWDGEMTANQLRGKKVSGRVLDSLYEDFKPEAESVQALKDYQEYTFFKMNADLRAGKEPTEEVRQMDKLFESAPQFEEEFTEDGERVMYEYYRSTESTVFEGLQEGDMLIDDGFTSTSIDASEADLFGEDAMYDAKVRIVDFANHPKVWVDAISEREGMSQKEVIFQRGTPFTFVGKDDDGYFVLLTGKKK